ncbi:MAG: glycosyltransferase family 2 protein [Bacteroidia bacterium]
MIELSIICPTYNEIRFIDKLTESLCADDGLQKEVLIVDGGSTDGTVERVGELQKKFPSIRLIHNPRRTSTAAFNIAFRESRGAYVAFVGAHAEYARDYFSIGLEALRNNECDAVGGPLQQKGISEKGQAIALVMSSRAGVGNTEFRTSDKRAYVDSVAFAIYRKSMIEKIGLMDEKLPVNQDDEFHYRINANGYRILMLPRMKATYYVRNSYRKLARQYFRYGLYKPSVLSKVKGSVRLRHLIPSLFTVYFISLLIYFLPLPLPHTLPHLLSLTLTLTLTLPSFLYLLLILSVTIRFRSSITVKVLALPVYPILHLSYGSGFIIGLFRKK